jgi:hypothetical protein
MGNKGSARAAELEIMGILGVVSTHGVNDYTEMHLARQFKPRVVIAIYRRRSVTTAIRSISAEANGAPLFPGSGWQ